MGVHHTKDIMFRNVKFIYQSHPIVASLLIGANLPSLLGEKKYHEIPILVLVPAAYTGYNFGAFVYARQDWIPPITTPTITVPQKPPTPSNSWWFYVKPGDDDDT